MSTGNSQITVDSECYLCSECGKSFLNGITFDNHLSSHVRGRKKVKGIRPSRRLARKNIGFKCTTSIHKRINNHQFRSEFKYNKCVSSGENNKAVTKQLKFSSLCRKKIKSLNEANPDSQNYIPQARVPLTVPLETGLDETSNQNYISTNRTLDESIETGPNDDDMAALDKVKEFSILNSKLLLDIIEAIEIEKRECDTKKFGGLFENMSQAMVKGSIKPKQLCYQIAASTARLVNTQTNRMVYSNSEYEFWEYINYLHGESTLRNLTGRKGFGLEREGEVGTQNPEDLEFNLAIPSRTERKKHNTHKPVSMKPGPIMESLEILKKESHLKTLNLSIDEKHLSSGMELKVKDGEISIEGDQEYFGKASTNKETDLDNLKIGLEMLDILEGNAGFVSLETSDSPSKDEATVSTASALLKINSLAAHFESSLKAKHEEASGTLKTLKSKTRKNLVNIAKEISEVSKLEKCLSELSELKTTLADTLLEAFITEDAASQLKLLRNYDELLISESVEDQNLVQVLNENYLYISTRSKFWMENVKLENTIPTGEIGAFVGLYNMKVTNDNIKRYFKVKNIPLDHLKNSEMFYKTLPSFSKALFMLNSSWEIYEVGTYVLDVDNVFRMASVGGSVMRNKMTDELECVHIFSSSLDDVCCLDILARMKLFEAKIGAITFVDEDGILKLATMELNPVLEQIWSLCLTILLDVSQLPGIKRTSNEMKELKQMLKTENITSYVKVMTLFAVKNTDVETVLEIEPGSVFACPEFVIPKQTDFKVEVQKFVIRANEIFKSSTLLLRPAAGQLLLFSVNNIDGRKSASERDDLITHYSRTGRGTQIVRDVYPQIEAAIDDIEGSGDARVVSFSADTAYHSVIDFSANGDIKNIVCLQYETFKQSKAATALKNLEFINGYIGSKPLGQLEVPLTWTEKQKGVIERPEHKVFPNLGDTAMELEMKNLNFPLNPLFEVPGEHNESENETDLSDTDSERETCEVETSNKIYAPSKPKSITVTSLKHAAEKVLLKNKDLLVIVAAQLQFPQKYEEFKSKSPVSEEMILPGLKQPLDLIAIPEVSKLKGHLRGSFIDLTHSGTRLR